MEYGIWSLPKLWRDPWSLEPRLICLSISSAMAAHHMKRWAAIALHYYSMLELLIVEQVRYRIQVFQSIMEISHLVQRNRTQFGELGTLLGGRLIRNLAEHAVFPLFLFDKVFA